MHFFRTIGLIFLALTSALYADGLMMPVNEAYSGDFLRNRLTKVNIEIEGLIVRTSVYQEFINESEISTDAVYSFPLPANARATGFIYWYEDKIYKAVLKVKEQSSNPGTGEGGVAALVNKYIGPNGIKIYLKDIPAGSIQKVQLDYIQLADYYQGSCTFQYPLQTGEFISYALDHLEFNVDVHSGPIISGFEIPDFPDYQLIHKDDHVLSVRMVKPKAYLNKNFTFTYHTSIEQMAVDFYSVNNDTAAGHFGLFLRPPNQVPADSLLPRRIIFLLSNSSLMFGYKLNQSIAAVRHVLDQLTDTDEFNIGVFSNSVQFWQSLPVNAKAENINAANLYLDEISGNSGSNMQVALQQCLTQIQDNMMSNAIVVFSNGYSYLDPLLIEADNQQKTGIFPVAIGDEFNFARLEMLAAYNYGFVTYVKEDDNMYLKMSRLLGQVTQPILKDVTIEYGNVDLTDLLPAKIPAAYAGTYFFMTGRYNNSGTSALSLGGISSKGPQVYDFLLNFSNKTNVYSYIESLWAKQMIEYLEWQIEIYGESQELKERLISISLTYNIRCRYTAYIADYETELPSYIPENLQNKRMPGHCCLVKNYPNPFNPQTTIVFYISQDASRAAPRFLRIYNVLGQLVYIIDLSRYGPGYHELHFEGRDWRGNPLPSGIYFIVMQAGSERSMMRITLLR